MPIADRPSGPGLSGIAGALSRLVARVVNCGVDANFATLRQILEATVKAA
jgi:hypothetical protein